MIFRISLLSHLSSDLVINLRAAEHRSQSKVSYACCQRHLLFIRTFNRLQQDIFRLNVSENRKNKEKYLVAT